MTKLADRERPCHGCAHSAAAAVFPGMPSGERPCCFCVRNPDLAEYVSRHQEQGCDGDGCKHPVHGFWYDGSPSEDGKVPRDNYIATDRLRALP